MSALLAPLEAVFAWLVAASWQASVLALLVLGLQQLLGARLNPRWRYALWLLVLARLVLPALPESALSLFQFAPPAPVALVEPVTHPLFVTAPLAAQPVVINAPILEQVHALSAYSILALVWLIGAGALLILTWIVNLKFLRQIKITPDITDPELRQLFTEAKAELVITRDIRLIESAQVQSPAIMGLFRPTLLLPTRVRDQFDTPELRLIFLHELAHLKRGDVLVQGLIALLQILHWFNPVLWYAFRRMRIDREPATDALVLSRAGEEEKERYGLMLIKLLEHFNQRHSIPTLVGILEDKDQFKRRFSLIARYTRGAYGWSLLGVLVLGIVATVGLTKAKEQTKEAEVSLKPADARDQLIDAARKGDAPALKKLLEQGLVYDAKVNPYMPTLLFYAGSPEVAKLLLQRGEKVDTRNSSGAPALAFVCASEKPNGETARVLLKAGADAKATDAKGNTLIMAAGNGACIDVLLEFGARLDAKDKADKSVWPMMNPLGDPSALDALIKHGLTFDPAQDGPNLLVQAANLLQVQRIIWLLAHGVDPNQPGVPTFISLNFEKQLPLSAAITGSSQSGDHLIEACQLLLDHGAKGTLNDALALVTSRYTQLIPLLHRSSAIPISELAWAVFENKPASELQSLLEKGIPPATEGGLVIPLMTAADYGDLPAVKLLIEHGAQADEPLPGTPEILGHPLTVLFTAAMAGQADVVDYLLHHGAKATYIDLSMSIGQHYPPNDPPERYEKTTRLLIDAGALKGITEDQSAGILIQAFGLGNRGNNVGIMRMLLDAGLSPTARISDKNAMAPQFQGKSVIEVARIMVEDQKQTGFIGDTKPILEMLEQVAAKKKTAPDPSRELLKAAADGDVATLQKLLDGGATYKTNKAFPTLLFTAGSPEVVDLLVKRGIDVSAVNNAGQTALAFVCIYGKKDTAEIARALIKNGAKVDATDMVGATPIMGAHDGATVDVLVAAGANLKAKNKEGRTVLTNGRFRVDVSAYDALLRAGAPFDPKTDGPILLFQAAWGNQLDLVPWLLDKGVDPNIPAAWTKDDAGKPITMLPMMAAAMNGHGEVIQLLLKRGAKGDGGMTTALANRQAATVKLLWDGGVHNISELAYAISQGAPVAEVQQILDKGIPVDPPQDTLYSPLALAGQLGSMETVKLLVGKGADLNGRDAHLEKYPNERFSPLALAASEGQDEIVAYLLEKGASPDPDALSEAAENSTPYEGQQRPKEHFEKTVRLLLDAGAQKNATPGQIGTALFSAIQTRQGPANVTVLKMLLDAGLSPDSPLPALIQLGRPPNTVIGYFRELYKTEQKNPNQAALADELKPFLDLLEQHAAPSVPSPAQTKAAGEFGSLPYGVRPIIEGVPLTTNHDDVREVLTLLFSKGKLEIVRPASEKSSVTLESIHEGFKVYTDTTNTLWIYDGAGQIESVTLLPGNIIPSRLSSEQPELWKKAPFTFLTSIRRNKHGKEPSFDGPLTRAIYSVDENEVKRILAKGEPVEVVDMESTINVGSPALLKILWEKEPLPEFTQMTYAVSQGAPISELEKLLAMGVPVERPWDYVTTPLGVAARLGNIEAARWLLAHGANIGAVMNPLNAAARGQSVEMIQFLLKNGAEIDPNSTLGLALGWTDNNQTCDLDKRITMADVLIKVGALEKMRADDRSRLLCIAYDKDSPSLVKHLLDDIGISPLVPINGNKSALDLAKERLAHPDEHRPLKNLQACIDLMEKAVDTTAAPPAPVLPALPTPFEKRIAEMKISVNFENKNAREAIQEIQAKAHQPDFSFGMNFADLPPNGIPSVSFKADEISVKDALERIRQIAGLRYIPLPTFNGYSVILAPVDASTKGVPSQQDDVEKNRQQRIAEINSIKLDELDYKNATMTDVLTVLTQKVKKADPTGTGVNFILRKTALPEPRIDLNLKNVLLLEALDLITKQAGLKYEATEYAIYLRPSTDDGDGFTVRSFLAPPGTFSATSGNSVDVSQKLFSNGIDFPIGATATYFPASGKLVVKASPDQLDKIGTLLNSSTAPPDPKDLVTIIGKVQVKDPKKIDFTRSRGVLKQGDVIHYWFNIEPDGSYTIPDVKYGKYAPTLTLFLRPEFQTYGKGGTTKIAQKTIDLQPSAPTDGPDSSHRVVINFSGEIDPATRDVRIGLQLINIREEAYLKNQGKVDAAVKSGDIAPLVQMKGVDLLSTPMVTTKFSQKASIDVVREFRYPTNYGKSQDLALPPGQKPGDVSKLHFPATPEEFETQDVGVSATLTPTESDGQVRLKGTLVVTSFEGFIESNISGVEMPTFSTKESLFLESLTSGKPRAMWIPGSQLEEETVTDQAPSGKKTTTVVTVKKRYILVVTATTPDSEQ